jgi:DNA-binding response OmpR family regulator
MPDKPIKVLIIDDEPDITEPTADILKKKGYTVFTALESDTALAIFEKENPSICLIDIHMPKSPLDGNAILERIRRKSNATHCIMLTRITEKDKVDEAKRLGANRYVLKPLDYQELLKLIQEASSQV